ncbi:MAG: TetR/AcrR family transcriptional regulator [Candidatus Thiodiazotropha sp.]|nr:TetR/AcrR family transcriptional regulator [Candidatus Thiodiazotropha sp.]MCM8884041.1 TetR/AcrR family transcriptional regulator [Candidatus Thiodiazotropha sp.]MCM8919702.1 TetR/AcrR family transcriptional regulator [Candidatus Thiodiazotropha sp.]
MPYTLQHKKASRQRILESAARSFLYLGYERTGINEIMHDAGMTRGAFYAHFNSKSELYDKALTYAAANGRFMAYHKNDKVGSAWLKGMLEGYLSQEHFEGAETPCPLAFIVTDIANREPEVRQTYTRIYKRMNRLIAHYTENKSDKNNDEVFALTALMIGGVALSRAVDDPGLADRLLASCRQAAVRLLDEDGE